MVSDFSKFCLDNMDASYSQNMQDLWALWESPNLYKGFFIEFGALNGVDASNSYLLERLGWDGIIAEPHPDYSKRLHNVRNCHVCTDAVFNESGLKLSFRAVNKFPALSTLSNSLQNDNEVSIERRGNYREITVDTISLTDLLKKYNAPRVVDYISIDTEGSEYEILKEFDFSIYQFNSLCVEFGTEEKRNQIYDLLTSHGYVRKFESLSGHDDWYTHFSHNPDYNDNRHWNLSKYHHDRNEMSKNRLSKYLRSKLSIADDVALIPNKVVAVPANRLPEYDIPPVSKGLQHRLDLAHKCSDCDNIPKVPYAGKISEMTDGRKVQLMFNGIKVLSGGYYGPWMAGLIEKMKGHHEPQEELVFYNLLPFIKEDGLMIEMGCYWAFYTCWYKQAKPKGKTISMEPHKNNLRIGRDNYKLNGFENGTFLHAFSGSENRVRGLLARDSEKVFSRDFLNLDEIFDMEEVNGQVDLLHMDIQGAETDVLEMGFHHLVANKVQYVIISTHHQSISGDPLTHQKCIQIIEKAGGRIIAEHDVYESYSGDGLICAYLGGEDIELPQMEISYCRTKDSYFREPSYDVK